MRTGVPCNENRFLPVRIDSQGVPFEPWVWVYSEVKKLLFQYDYKIILEYIPEVILFRVILSYMRSTSVQGFTCFCQWL